METKRTRQLINRSAGFTGSFMPIERAQSIARKNKQDPNDKEIVAKIRLADQATKKRI